MSAIVLVDGAVGGASVHGSDCVVAPWLESLPSDAVFVAPGDEIHVDAEAGFLKCAALPARGGARSGLTSAALLVQGPRHAAGGRPPACHAVRGGDARQ